MTDSVSAANPAPSATRPSSSPRARRWAMWQGAAALSMLAMVPLATSAMARIDRATQSEVDRLMDVFLQVRSNYVEQVDDAKLIEGAINGMLTSLDPHSGYLDARGFTQMRTQTEGQYGGLGLSVTAEDGVVKVIAPQADTPAARAGMKSGDYITHIDGEMIVGMNLDEAVEKMRGRPGTKIELKVLREGRDQPIDVSIVREVIELKPVKWAIDGNIGILTVTTFSANAADELREAMAAVQAKLGRRPGGYILDLRSNPGGLLDEAVGISDLFLTRGEIVSQRGRAKSDIERYFAKAAAPAGDVPVIVLIDAGSASASEIVAGALQDHNRALIMGERSFGKGSVQTLLPLSESTALRLTTARYYTPSGRSVQEGGIDPDVRVPQLSDPDYQTRPRFRESDLRRHLVNQLKVDNGLIEKDDKPDPRFTQTADELKAKGISDFQLHYALETIRRVDGVSARLARANPAPASAPAKVPAARRN